MKFRNIEVSNTMIFNTQRRAVAHLAASSWREAPHVSNIYKPDITDFYNEFIKLNEKRKDDGKLEISFKALMIKVIVEGLLKAPELNSHIEYKKNKKRGTLHILDEIHVAMPWTVSEGRVINPNMFYAESKTLEEMQNAINVVHKRLEKTDIDELLYRTAFIDNINGLKKLKFLKIFRAFPSELTKHKAKRPCRLIRKEYYKIPLHEKLTAKDLTCGTVTITNYGALYEDELKGVNGYYSAINIMPPQTFVIGISSIQEKAAIFTNENKTQEIGIRKMLSMCLVVDSRIYEHHIIMRFINRLNEIFLNPSVIHKW